MSKVTQLKTSKYSKDVSHINSLIDSAQFISSVSTVPLTLCGSIINAGFNVNFSNTILHALRAVPHFLNLVTSNTGVGTVSGIMDVKVLELEEHYIKFVIELFDGQSHSPCMSIVIRSALAKEYPLIQDDLPEVEDSILKEIMSMEDPVTHDAMKGAYDYLANRSEVTRRIIRPCVTVPEGCTGIAYSNQAIPSYYNVLIELISPIKPATRYTID